MALPVAGYDSLIEDILRRTEEQRKVAEARGVGEAQRRGLVSGTGTSDIEMSLRRAQTEPVVQGGQSNIAQILANIAEQQEARKYQTGEREASQGWQTGEREGAQGWQTGENQAQRGWQTGEREGAQTWQGKMAGYIDPNTGQWTPTYDQSGKKYYGAFGEGATQWERDVIMNKMNQPKKKKWYQTGAEVLGNAAGQFAGTYGGVKAGQNW